MKDDGLPAFYSPDFLLRTADAVYLVETKAQQQTIHPNVQRRRAAATPDLMIKSSSSPLWTGASSYNIYSVRRVETCLLKPLNLLGLSTGRQRRLRS